jgi:hypothetical protein
LQAAVFADGLNVCSRIHVELTCFGDVEGIASGVESQASASACSEAKLSSRDQQYPGIAS